MREILEMRGVGGGVSHVMIFLADLVYIDPVEGV